MPRDQRGKNKKFKHDRQSKREFTEISQGQLDKVDRYAQGIDIQKQEEEENEQQQQIQEKFKPKPMNFVRNYDVPDQKEEQQAEQVNQQKQQQNP